MAGSTHLGTSIPPRSSLQTSRSKSMTAAHKAQKTGSAAATQCSVPGRRRCSDESERSGTTRVRREAAGQPVPRRPNYLSWQVRHRSRRTPPPSAIAAQSDRRLRRPRSVTSGRSERRPDRPARVWIGSSAHVSRSRLRMLHCRFQPHDEGVDPQPRTTTVSVGQPSSRPSHAS
jgi:hypothetical protein